MRPRKTRTSALGGAHVRIDTIVAQDTRIQARPIHCRVGGLSNGSCSLRVQAAS